MSDPVADAQSVITDLDVENSNSAGGEDNFHLVILHRGVFVDRYQNPFVVPRLGTVNEGAELGNLACALEVPKVVRLLGEWKCEPFPAKNVTKE